jgi:hypothetical protein
MRSKEVARMDHDATPRGGEGKKVAAAGKTLGVAVAVADKVNVNVNGGKL